MGAPYDQREVADRKRTVKARKQGTTKGKYRTYGVVVPSWLAREIAGSDDPDTIEERMRAFEFRPEKVPEGILYRVVRVEAHMGWEDER